MSSGDVRNPRVEAALERALSQGETAELLVQLERSSNMPGPRPNVELGRAVAARIATSSRRADPLVRLLLAGTEYQVMVGALALGARWAKDIDAPGASEGLQQLCEDPRPHVRDAVILALRSVLHGRGERAVEELGAWTDGYLQAHTVLEALAERTTLSELHAVNAVLARFSEAFALADAAPRAADRSHGLRTLRRRLPAQIAVLAARWAEPTVEWVTERTAAQRPETREVIESAITGLRKVLSVAAAQRLTDALTSTAAPPRDPSRIVHGTRRRGGGRRR
jgi:hypothetical protein